jgi:hypothetical protein
MSRPKKIPQPTRPCMKCREPFESEWIGNRLCEKCKRPDVMELNGGFIEGGQHDLRA